MNECPKHVDVGQLFLLAVVLMAGGPVTLMLRRLEAGDRSALNSIVPLVYDELHGIANVHMRGERVDHTLQATALVHEALLRMARRENPSWENSRHFLHSAAAVMRSVLVNHARDRSRQKRGGDNKKLPLDELVGAYEDKVGDLIALDEALEKLAAINPRHGKLVELRFFAGASVKEAADALGVSERTVKSDWAITRRWLWSALQGAR